MDERLQAIIDKRKPGLTRKQRLERMPECRRFVDWVAAEFDRDIAKIRAAENGYTMSWKLGDK